MNAARPLPVRASRAGSRSELIPELPVELLLACTKEPRQSAAVSALRAALEGRA